MVTASVVMVVVGIRPSFFDREKFRASKATRGESGPNMAHPQAFLLASS